MRLLTFVICLCLASLSLAQEKFTLLEKIAPPVQGYWQQDVAYAINASLNDETELISGDLILQYTNNSPDALTQLYFHVYQNMFEPNSYKNQFDGNSDAKAEEWQKTECNQHAC